MSPNTKPVKKMTISQYIKERVLTYDHISQIFERCIFCRNIVFFFITLYFFHNRGIYAISELLFFRFPDKKSKHFYISLIKLTNYLLFV